MSTGALLSLRVYHSDKVPPWYANDAWMLCMWLDICPGAFGAYTGLKDSTCAVPCSEELCSNQDISDAQCKEGFYCEEGSSTPVPTECGGSGEFLSIWFKRYVTFRRCILPKSVVRTYSSITWILLNWRYFFHPTNGPDAMWIVRACPACTDCILWWCIYVC